MGKQSQYIAACEPPEGSLDLSAAIYAHDPYPLYKSLRQHSPVHRLSDGSYAISRYADVRAALHDHERFAAGWSELPMHKAGWLAEDCRRGLFLLDLEPPAHLGYRQLLHRYFTRQAVAQLTGQLSGAAGALLDDVPTDASTVDAVRDYANRLASAMLASISGLSLDDAVECRRCLTLTDAITEEEPAPEHKRLVEAAIRHQHAVFNALVETRRRSPRDDFASALAGAKDSVDIYGALYIIAAACFEPASTLANAILLLSQMPELRRRLVRQPETIPAFVEETLRFCGSTLAAVRQTTRDTQQHDVHIPAGAMVLLLLGSANRDETQFPEPDTFRLHRPNITTHLAFGHGAHYCLGSHLARLLIHIGVQRWLQFAAEFSCPPPAELKWFSRGAFRTLQALPVSLH